MKTKLKLSIVFLIFGLIFSSIIRLQFNTSSGFEFQKALITLPLPIFDFAAHSSNNLVLSSSFIGYFFFVVFGLLLISDFKSLISKNMLLVIFMLLTFAAIVFEINSLIQDFNSNFTGHHLRIGPTLFLLGLLVYLRNYRTKVKS
ncbi:MAG: hypothetical protein A2033_17765 [Bacteroidetes bacterium GWA2_31_9]|nr:MAG: hypothetical protein A2033_17765 [Bacteroidetes bacterium GWA2_31_9]